MSTTITDALYSIHNRFPDAVHRMRELLTPSREYLAECDRPPQPAALHRVIGVLKSAPGWVTMPHVVAENDGGFSLEWNCPIRGRALDELGMMFTYPEHQLLLSLFRYHDGYYSTPIYLEHAEVWKHGAVIGFFKPETKGGQP